MLVYGDRKRAEEPRAILARIAGRLEGLEHVFPGVVRHGSLTAAFIEAGELAQGLADAELEQSGADGRSPVQDAAMALVMHLARALSASWTSDFTALPPDCAAEIDAIAAPPLPDRVTIATPEGYAFYAVYPELYLEAAWEAPDRPEVIGIRSIGASLAAMVAVGAGSGPPLTIRPTGHPFAREVKLTEPIDPSRAYAVVDEGPGLSGSSFGAVADLLEDAGAPPNRITFFPSHDGEPGVEASERHRSRWKIAHKQVKDFDEVILPRLPGWFADLVGEPLAPLKDLSAGRWSRGAPTDPQRERRKYLLRTATGPFLLKFAGLGRIGEEKLTRAQALHEAGFTPQPLGVRHGFLIERWQEDTRPLGPPDRPVLLETLARYLAFRAAHFPGGGGAGLDELAAMAARNASLDVTPPNRPLRRVHTDNRLHAWEWLKLPDGRILKTDALDHDDAHDLIGCQDIAWDIAGANVEFGLSPEETGHLTQAVGADPELVAFYRPCYAAFQLGLWTYAGADDQVARYRRALPNAN